MKTVAAMLVLGLAACGGDTGVDGPDPALGGDAVVATPEPADPADAGRDSAPVAPATPVDSCLPIANQAGDYLCPVALLVHGSPCSWVLTEGTDYLVHCPSCVTPTTCVPNGAGGCSDALAVCNDAGLAVAP